MFVKLQMANELKKDSCTSICHWLLRCVLAEVRIPRGATHLLMYALGAGASYRDSRDPKP